MPPAQPSANQGLADLLDLGGSNVGANIDVYGTSQPAQIAQAQQSADLLGNLTDVN